MTIHYSKDAVGNQRTEQGLAYDRWQKQFSRYQSSRDPEVVAKWFRRHFGVDCQASEVDPPTSPTSTTVGASTTTR